jgi:hypothetical protein
MNKRFLSSIFALALVATFAVQADAITPKQQQNATRNGTRTTFGGVLTSDGKLASVLESCDGKTAYDFSGLNVAEAGAVVGDYFTVDGYLVGGTTFKGKTTYKVNGAEDYEKAPKPAGCIPK